MKNVLVYDWITGEPYHTIWHCMRENPILISIWGLCNLLVLFYYIRITIQARKETKLRALQKIKFFIGVFVFCGLTYGFSVIRIFSAIYPVQCMFLIVLIYISRKFTIQIEKDGLFTEFTSETERVLKERDLLQKEVEVKGREIDHLKSIISSLA